MNGEKGTKDVFILHHYNLSSIFPTNPSTLTHTRQSLLSLSHTHTHIHTHRIVRLIYSCYIEWIQSTVLLAFSTPLFESTLFQSIPQRRHIGEEDKWKSGWRRVSPPLTLIHTRINREVGCRLGRKVEPLLYFSSSCAWDGDAAEKKGREE